MATKPIIFFEGTLYKVELAQQDRGRSKVKKFLDELKATDKRRAAKITSLVHSYASSGRIENDQQFKKLKGGNKLYEFKDFQVRVLMYHCGPGVIALTHGFKKKDDNTPQVEIDRGENISNEYDKIRKGFKDV